MNSTQLRLTAALLVVLGIVSTLFAARKVYRVDATKVKLQTNRIETWLETRLDDDSIDYDFNELLVVFQ